MATFVLDGSVALSWCFTDESTPFTDSIQGFLQNGDSCIVPAIWPSEVANGVRIAERRGRISAAEGDTFLSLISGFPIEVMPVPMTSLFQEVLSIARTFTLTVYDASYLSLALQRRLPLATLDEALRKATIKAGGVLL